MNAELAIVGCGARTPVGFGRRPSAAAVRAGVSVIADHPFMRDRFGEPMKVTRDPFLDPELAGSDRLLALGATAALEALSPLETVKGKRPTVSLVLSFGEARPGQAQALPSTVGAALCSELDSIVSIGQRMFGMAGHAGGILAMDTARRIISQGQAELVLAGGVDSYLCRDTMEWLDDNEQLHSDENLYGFCPGEAAGFVLLARQEAALNLGLTPLITLSSVGSALEKNLIKTEDICLGDGLAAAIRSATEPQKGATINRIIGDMNGERYRGNEYGFAALKTSGLLQNAAAFESPADCWGDVGAASGPLYVSLAIEAEQRGYSKGPLSLIWASSESGWRGAALLRESEGA
jgi:3-oxoacyl-[acyl-carrier-protein] synthase-1